MILPLFLKLLLFYTSIYSPTFSITPLLKAEVIAKQNVDANPTDKIKTFVIDLPAYSCRGKSCSR